MIHSALAHMATDSTFSLCCKPRAHYVRTSSGRIAALADALFAMAGRGAADYCRTHSVTPDVDALTRLLNDVLGDTTLRAVADAREALNCGMIEIAQARVRADLRLCGIHAAKFLHVGWSEELS